MEIIYRLIRENLLASLLLLTSGLVSVSMTLINKHLSQAFTLPLTTILIQNTGAMVCSFGLVASGWQSILPFKSEHILPAAVNGLWLVACLWSSLVALKQVTVPLYVVANNARPLCTAIIDWLWLRHSLTGDKFFGLFMILIGAIFYATNDQSSSMFGICLAFLNTFLVSSLGVYENVMMNKMRGEQTAIGVNLYRLVFSTPVLIFLIMKTEKVDMIFYFDNLTLTFLAFSSVLCLAIGVVMFALQPLVTATTIQVSNVSFKLVSTVAGIIMFPTNVSLTGWLGYLTCMCGFGLYSFGGILSK